MRKSQFTEQQIVAALRQGESDTTVGEVCRKLGVTEQTYYRWKRKFAGMGIAELRRLLFWAIALAFDVRSRSRTGATPAAPIAACLLCASGSLSAHQA